MMGAKGSESEIMLMERMGSENGSGSSRKKDEDHNQKMGRRERSCWKSSKSCSSSKPSLLSDPFYSPISERMERSKVDQMGHSRRASTSSNHRLLQSDHHFMEVDEKQETPNRNPNHHHNHHHQTTRHALKDVCHSLTTSKQLLKVLSRVWSIEEQKSTCISLFATLRSELDRACLQVSRLIQDRTAAQSRAEIDLVLRRLEEEKAVWRMKEECRVQTALASLLSELKAERKLRKQAERLNKRLGRELCEANTSLAMSTKEVETQKRAMQVLERVCEELARGGGGTEDNYKAAKLMEEEEKEKKERDEERVGTKKMAESRSFEFEELKNELGSHLAREEDIGGGGEGGVIWQSYSPSLEKLKALEKHFRETLPGGYPPPALAAGREEEEEEEEDEEGELHCIELNMEEGGNNGGMGFESGSSEAWRNDYDEDEIERYNMIKDLRYHFVSSSKIIPPS
ncbi:unnamed protein product [Cuscuta campestris]|uniref:Uncharacterized protein n=1 Tax=Cuscuta campestris TaxID=132261 RepID=A0A484L524_9ASTE|nr:unnamed protein product [Cuscuta campestris]